LICYVLNSSWRPYSSGIHAFSLKESDGNPYGRAACQTTTRTHAMPAALDDANAPAEALAVSHAEFRSGVPAGRYHLIVNPERAQKYVKHRLFVAGISLPLLGIGAALAISGYLWAGLPMVLIGFVLPRIIKAHAPKILLHLAMNDEKTYFEAMDYEILEVRRR
jgi:hypothetical protein